MQMGIYSLANVPAKSDDLEIKGVVEGEQIYVIRAEKGSKWRDGRSVMMTSTLVGEHMLARPDDLRRMYADDLATVIRLARDAGYAQALADVRGALGIQC